MAKKTQRSAAIVITCAVAAVIFFIVAIIVVANVVGDDEDPFKDREADPYMTFNKMDVNIEWNNDHSCKITQKLVAEFKRDEASGGFEQTHGIYVDIPINSGEKVRNLKVINVSPYRSYSIVYEGYGKIVRAIIGDDDKYFNPGDTLSCTLIYDYITPEHKYGPDVVAFMAIGQGWTCPVENATVTMKYPKAPDLSATDHEYGIWIAGDRADADGIWSSDKKTLTVQTSLGAFEGIEIAYKMPDGTLKNYSSGEYAITLVIGLVLFAVAIVLELFLAKNKPLTPIVDYYPPRVGGGDDGYFDDPNAHKLKIRRMLPVQMGKIIDDSCSPYDVTSLIFYWASNGFLTIDDRDGKTYLIKEHDLDAITGYERKLFDNLFSRGSQNEDGKTEVSVNSISGSFAPAINACKNSVNAEYHGKFYKGGFTALSYLMTFLCAAYGVCVTVFSTLRVGSWMINLIGFVTIIPVVLSAVIGSILAKQFFKLSKRRRVLLITGYTVLTVALSFAASFSLSFDVMGWLERLVFVGSLAAASVISPFLLVRKPEYNEQLNAILGFRDFLRDAEKDRLETMLESDPQYYYNILPYANVLGVSDIWADKFKDITIEPPAYYRSNRPDIFDIYILSRLTHSVGSSLKYVPPKTNGGSYSGHHGGGFSGGSFGGGGGGRW